MLFKEWREKTTTSRSINSDRNLGKSKKIRHYMQTQHILTRESDCRGTMSSFGRAEHMVCKYKSRFSATCE